MQRTLIALAFLQPSATLYAGVDAESLRRGVVVTHQDTAKPMAAQVVRLEPTVALSLKAKESSHPRLSTEGNTVRWDGFLNVSRADTYHFCVQLRGGFRLRIGDKEALAAEVKDGPSQRKEGMPIRLEAGVLPFSAEFTRIGDEARVELLWESKHFREEPLPFDVLGHIPDKATPQLKHHTAIEQGRRLVEDHACIKCHQPDGEHRVAKTLQSRQGPDLSNVGQRVQGEWIYRWLDDPRKMRSASVMPRLFVEGVEGANERYAVMRYLVSLGGPLVDRAPKPPKQQIEQHIKEGQQLFTSVGCIVCHGPVGDRKPFKADEEEKTFALYAAPLLYPLKGMGGKTTPDQLAMFLRNPHSINPTSRMPNMLLDEMEAKDLAWFLCEATAGKERKLPEAPTVEQRNKSIEQYLANETERDTLKKLPEEKQWIELGKRIVEAKGCVACHTIAPGGKALPGFTARTKLEGLTPLKEKKGCLSDDEKTREKAPLLPLDAKEKDAVRLFLKEGLQGPGTVSPTYQAKATLERLNCLACHGREGEGGLSISLVEQFRKVEKAENAGAVSPPPLTGVGHKLRTPWLREVLTKAGRARPWMGLRMPQFGEAHVGGLPEALAALEGTETEETIHKVALDTEKIGAGRFLVGKQAFGCVSCHDMAGRPNFGTRGPDLATMTARTRFDWYTRWLHDAQRIQPGTRMPSVFPDGKSQIAAVLKGNATAQSEAMWAYLSLGPTLPLPEGLEAVKGLVLSVKDRPVVFRTFLPDAGTRAIAVGYPDGIAMAFDAATCRLAYAWAGNFLDVSPVWNERGGNPAKVLGARVWTGPVGCAWGVGVKGQPPDFVARAKEPGFGGKLPEGQWHAGKEPLKFEGYTLNEQGQPTFTYRIALDERSTLTIKERPEPLRSALGIGLKRVFHLSIPSKQEAWMFVVEGGGTPRVVDDKGLPVSVDLKGDRVEVPSSHLVALPQTGGKVQIVRLTQGPKESRWRLQSRSGKWDLMLKLPSGQEAATVPVTVEYWTPHDNEAGLLKEILSVR